MINVKELINDPDFCQPNGITIERTTVAVVNHEEVLSSTTHKVVGIITIANELSSEMLQYADVNKEHIHVFTYKKLFVTGNSVNGDQSYIGDIVHWQGKRYKVLSCMDDAQYGFCRSTCEAMEQDVI